MSAVNRVCRATRTHVSKTVACARSVHFPLATTARRSLATRSTVLCDEQQGLFGKISSKVKSFIQPKGQPEPTPEPATPPKPQSSPPGPQTLAGEAQRIAKQLPSLEALGKQAMAGMSAEETAKMERNIGDNKFDLDDFRSQLKQLIKASNMMDLASKIPGMSSKMATMMPNMQAQKAQTELQIKILDAMTPEERSNPKVLFQNAMDAKQRIARTSGRSLAEVNHTLDTYLKMKKMYSVINEMKAQGKPLPSTFEDMAKLLQQHTGAAPPPPPRR